MTTNENAEQYAHLPEHPEEPFLRIVGAATRRAQNPGDRCPWGLAFHVVFPNSPRPRRVVRARILSRLDRRLIEELPEVVYPQGPCVSHAELYDSRVLVDREFGDLYEVSKLPEGAYIAESELLDGDGNICCRDSLNFDLGPLSFLKHRIDVVFDGWKQPPKQAHYLAGFVLTGDVDGDGEAEYVHVAGSIHMAAYRGNGELLWRYDDPDGVAAYSIHSCLWDLDGNGRSVIVCPRGKFGALRLCKLEGATGKVLKEIEYPVINELEPTPVDAPDLWKQLRWTGHAIRVVEEQHMLGGYIRAANFRGRPGRQDIMLQVGEQNCVTIVAMTNDLEELWRYRCDNGRAGHCAGFFDADGDGCDELALGTSLIDHDGKLLWDLPFESFAAPWEDDHVDESNGGDLSGDGRMKIVYSSRLVVDALTGERLWIDPTWHGQQAEVAKLRDDVPGLQLVFADREYRHSRHMLHGEWHDVRDSEGNRLWDRRFMGMQQVQIVDWLGNGLQQVTSSPDLQRHAPNPNLQIFDGWGTLVDVLPTVAPHYDEYLHGQVPPGHLVQHPSASVPHGEILVFASGRMVEGG